ncbi:MAG TPA: YtxH domain-containing protein [Myxococcaceae bacterium]|nr:YtxH domain-containing protein [Myxococcaceae bacterium]
MFAMKDLKDIDLKDLNKKLKNLDKDDLLELVGLQTRQDSITPVLTAFGVGLLVGAGVGLLLAPKSGREMREDLRGRINGATDQITNTVQSVTGQDKAQVRT